MYLLSTQALYNLVFGEPTMDQWIGSVDVNDIGLSTISIGEVRWSIDAIGPGEGRASTEAEFHRLLALARRTQRIYSYGEVEAEHYAHIAGMELPYEYDGDTESLSDMNRMVVATALSRALVLVEGAQPYQGMIGNLRVVEPA